MIYPLPHSTLDFSFLAMYVVRSNADLNLQANAALMPDFEQWRIASDTIA